MLAVAASVAWLYAMSRKRLMEDVPTSPVAGVALGLNEVVGLVRHPEPMTSPLGRVSCVWWQLERLRRDFDRLIAAAFRAAPLPAICDRGEVP